MGGPNKRNAPNSTTQRTRKEFRQLRQRSQHQEGGGPKHRPLEVEDETTGLPYTTGGQQQQQQQHPWIPNDYTTFKLLVSARLSAAFWSFISDCDETYNYWEPMHFLIYGKGFQTWEYSPQYALRSYLYVLVHALPGWMYNALLSPNPMYIFYSLRCIMAVVCSLCELYFFKGVVKEVGPNVGRISLAFMVFSAGFFISSTAFLPSTTSMYLTMVSHGAWFHQSYPLAIFATALSALLSWPFAALLGAPIALDILLRKRRFAIFFKWSAISALVILLPQISLDSDYYGKLVSAPLNIVVYNVFTSHGPDLYGTEPWHYYLVNGILNFNLAFLAALLVVPLHYLAVYLIGIHPESKHFLPHWLSHMALYLWLLVFGLQPHKEERFLFPVYPLVCLAAASAVDSCQKLFYYMFIKVKAKHYLTHTHWISISTLAVYSVLCLSRIVAIYHNYHAPIDVWMHIAHMPKVDPGRFGEGRQVNVCIGKEWHRFPNSFFLPNQDWQLSFLRSEFRGQLPQPYAEASDGDIKEATRLHRKSFNDLNKEETDRYVSNPAGTCDFIVDLELPDTTGLEPAYSANRAQWEEEFSVEFLDAKRSSKFLRAFYVPFLSWSKCSYGKYVLLRNINKPAAKRKFHR